MGGVAEGDQQGPQLVREPGALLRGERCEELFLGVEVGDDRPVDELVSGLGETDDDLAPVGGAGALDEASGDEPVDPVRHRPGRDHGGSDELPCGEFVRRVAATQRGEHVELPTLEFVFGEGAGQFSLGQSGEPRDASDDLHRGHIEVGTLCVPLLDDLVDCVCLPHGLTLPQRGLIPRQSAS